MNIERNKERVLTFMRFDLEFGLLQFSKSRRQRIMDKRASKNMQQASSAQESLSSLIVDRQEVNQLSQDATGFYFCMLSQNSIQDVLLGEDKEDAIGFGLAVKRNEVVLDEPTMVSSYKLRQN